MINTGDLYNPILFDYYIDIIDVSGDSNFFLYKHKSQCGVPVLPTSDFDSVLVDRYMSCK